MGIYIKGMEMPKCCARCELCQDEMLCRVTGLCVDFSTMYDNRMYNCPLTEVSEPHGRLIDADALNRIYKEKRHEHPWQHDGDDWYVGVIDANDELINAPTVIESEVEE